MRSRARQDLARRSRHTPGAAGERRSRALNPAVDTIRLYTTSWCADCRWTKQFLRERGVAFEKSTWMKIPTRKN